jgi:hypothetical protein
MKLEEYFDRLIGGRSRLRPIPSALATVLRERSTYRIHDAGLNRAVELATAAAGKSDSTRAGKGPLQPAPGPAPIPGGSPGGAKGAPAPGTRPAPQRPPVGDTATPKAGTK